MPNWCSNYVTIYGEDFSKVKDLLLTKTDDDGLFEHTVGIVKEGYLRDEKYQHLGDVILDDKYFNWYDHNVNEYGTKWDVNEISFDVFADPSDEHISFSFESAWSPPLEWARKLSDKFKVIVVIEYAEGGCNFGGRSIFENGDETESEQYTYLNWMLVDDTSGTRFKEEIEYIVSDMDKDEFEEYKQDIIEYVEEQLNSTFVKTVVDVFEELEKSMFVES
ncbi:MAG: DUF1281 family ferredoxin-like fold protein [Planctomycetota bacterium]|jgi:hypothetical protein